MTENTTQADTPRAAGPGAGAMPLGARQLLMIGGLCVPVGLVAGPYLLLAQLLAPAGVAMVAVALSYRAQQPWFSRWSWTVAAAGVLWVAATATYYASIMIAADASAPLPGSAQMLYNAGTVFFAVMAAATLTAIVLRMISARRASREQASGPELP
ncbi:hypothetical protein ACVWY0_003970 [Arthrobacter sp. UYNi723]